MPSTPAQPEPSSTDDAASPPTETPAPSFSPRRPKAAEIDHTDSELPDAQAVVLAELGREANRRNAPADKPDEIAAGLEVYRKNVRAYLDSTSKKIQQNLQPGEGKDKKATQ